MTLGELTCLIDNYTYVNTICIILNGKVLSLYDRKDIYNKITGGLENVEVKKHFLDFEDINYIIILDVNNFKAVFKI